MDYEKTPNEWLAYSLKPRELSTALRPAMWGNGQIEVMADLERPCVGEVVCFGFGAEALWYGPKRGEQHLLVAVYDADTGKKYFLYSTASSKAQHSTVTFRPDRQIWHYEFDDLMVTVSLILPRLHPGYLFKLEISPGRSNKSQRWFVYHELRAFAGNMMYATKAEYDLQGGRVWCKSSDREHGEAIGSTCDAQEVSLGLDGEWATDIMAKVLVERDNSEGPATAYFARAVGDTIQNAKDGLAKLLSSPKKLEVEAKNWWNQYLNEVPRLDVPDEAVAKKFLWYWTNFRMNRIDVPFGKQPAGISRSNNTHLTLGPCISEGHQLLEANQLLHDPKPARDTMLYWLCETRKSGMLSPGVRKTGDHPGNYASDTHYFCGLLHKYLLASGDLAMLKEDIGGKTVLRRLEDAVEAYLPFCDKKTGLYPNGDEAERLTGTVQAGKPSTAVGSLSEAQTRFRGGAGTFYSDTNAVVYGGFLAMAEIEELAQNSERSARYRQVAEELRGAIKKHWNEKLQFFCDLRPDGSFSDYLGYGGFMTGLFANPPHRPGGVATEEQAANLAEWCNHPDFVGELGVLSLARSSPYFDPMNWKGRNSGFNFFPTNQVTAGLYAHGCYEEAHRQLFKQFRRLGENAGLGPRYSGEAYNPDTGEIIPWRFQNFHCNLPAVSSVIEGVFGLRLTNDALAAHVNSPWPCAKLSNLRIRKSLLDLELMEDGTLVARIDGKEVARSMDRSVRLPWKLFD